jgi:hypothetical protein
MATFNVKARSFTPSSVVTGSTTYVTTTEILPTKTISVPAAATPAAVIAEIVAGGPFTTEVYNSTEWDGTALDGEKVIVTIGCLENSVEVLQIIALNRSSGNVTVADTYTTYTLLPGKVIALPFLVNSAVTLRDELPRLFLARPGANPGDVVAEVTITY